MDKELRRELLLDHYQHPINRGLVDGEGYLLFHTNNESCIDHLDIAIKVQNQVIEDIRFDGEACAISTSATSVMIKTLLGKSLDEAQTIMKNYENMIHEKSYDETLLGELNLYNEIYKQPNRKTCALLPFQAIRKLFEQIKEQ